MGSSANNPEPAVMADSVVQSPPTEGTSPSLGSPAPAVTGAAGPAAAASVAVPTGRLASMFRSLRYRDFALFWTGNFLSNIGTWMQNLALFWQILLITNSPFLLGLNGFLGTVPSLVFSLPG